MGSSVKKSKLRTVRFSDAEAAQIDGYLEKNPLFDTFSALARVATLSFVGEARRFRLEPVSEPGKRGRRPRFLWDYDLSEEEVREILARPGLSDTKRFVMERILTEGRFEEVFDFLTTDELTRHLDRLFLPPSKKRHWQYALARWRNDDGNA